MEAGAFYTSATVPLLLSLTVHNWCLESRGQGFHFLPSFCEILRSSRKGISVVVVVAPAAFVRRSALLNTAAADAATAQFLGYLFQLIYSFFSHFGLAAGDSQPASQQKQKQPLLLLSQKRPRGKSPAGERLDCFA